MTKNRLARLIGATIRAYGSRPHESIVVKLNGQEKGFFRERMHARWHYTLGSFLDIRPLLSAVSTWTKWSASMKTTLQSNMNALRNAMRTS